MRKLNIAIVGLGNIGSYLFNYLNINRKILTDKNNCLPIIKYVSAKNKNKKRSIKIKKSQWVNNYLEITKLKNVDLIVELIGGSEGAC
jgi:homoserine dehydrogenase